MGRKRKTRWRRLSIGEISGNEDEEVDQSTSPLSGPITRSLSSSQNHSPARAHPDKSFHQHHHHTHSNHNNNLIHSSSFQGNIMTKGSHSLQNSLHNSNTSLHGNTGANGSHSEHSSPSKKKPSSGMNGEVTKNGENSTSSSGPSSTVGESSPNPASGTTNGYGNGNYNGGQGGSGAGHYNHYDHSPSSHYDRYHYHKDNYRPPSYYSNYAERNGESGGGRGGWHGKDYHNHQGGQYHQGYQGSYNYRNNYNNYRNSNYAGGATGGSASGGGGGSASATGGEGYNGGGGGEYHYSSRSYGPGRFRRSRSYPTSNYYYANGSSPAGGSTQCDNTNKPSYNQDEYTKITTPRQDVLFKKGYLSQKKSSVDSASTGTTPSASNNGTPDTQSTNGINSDYSEGYENGETDCVIPYDDAYYYGPPPEAVFTDPNTGQVYYGHCSSNGEYYDAYPVSPMMVAGYPTAVYYPVPYPIDWNGVAGPMYPTMVAVPPPPPGSVVANPQLHPGIGEDPLDPSQCIQGAESSGLTTDDLSTDKSDNQTSSIVEGSQVQVPPPELDSSPPTTAAITTDGKVCPKPNSSGLRGDDSSSRKETNPSSSPETAKSTISNPITAATPTPTPTSSAKATIKPTTTTTTNSAAPNITSTAPTAKPNGAYAAAAKTPRSIIATTAVEFVPKSKEKYEAGRVPSEMETKPGMKKQTSDNNSSKSETNPNKKDKAGANNNLSSAGAGAKKPNNGGGVQATGSNNKTGSTKKEESSSAIGLSSQSSMSSSASSTTSSAPVSPPGATGPVGPPPPMQLPLQPPQMSALQHSANVNVMAQPMMAASMVPMQPQQNHHNNNNIMPHGGGNHHYQPLRHHPPPPQISHHGPPPPAGYHQQPQQHHHQMQLPPPHPMAMQGPPPPYHMYPPPPGPPGPGYVYGPPVYNGVVVPIAPVAASAAASATTATTTTTITATSTNSETIESVSGPSSSRKKRKKRRRDKGGHEDDNDKDDDDVDDILQLTDEGSTTTNSPVSELEDLPTTPTNLQPLQPVVLPNQIPTTNTNPSLLPKEPEPLVSPLNKSITPPTTATPSGKTRSKKSSKFQTREDLTIKNLVEKISPLESPICKKVPETSVNNLLSEIVSLEQEPLSLNSSDSKLEKAQLQPHIFSTPTASPSLEKLSSSCNSLTNSSSASSSSSTDCSPSKSSKMPTDCTQKDLLKQELKPQMESMDKILQVETPICFQSSPVMSSSSLDIKSPSSSEGITSPQQIMEMEGDSEKVNHSSADQKSDEEKYKSCNQSDSSPDTDNRTGNEAGAIQQTSDQLPLPNIEENVTEKSDDNQTLQQTSQKVSPQTSPKKAHSSKGKAAGRQKKPRDLTMIPADNEEVCPKPAEFYTEDAVHQLDLHLLQPGSEPSSPDDSTNNSNSFNTTQSVAGSEIHFSVSIESELLLMNRTASIDEVEEDLPHEQGNSSSPQVLQRELSSPSLVLLESIDQSSMEGLNSLIPSEAAGEVLKVAVADSDIQREKLTMSAKLFETSQQTEQQRDGETSETKLPSRTPCSEQLEPGLLELAQGEPELWKNPVGTQLELESSPNECIHQLEPTVEKNTKEMVEPCVEKITKLETSPSQSSPVKEEQVLTDLGQPVEIAHYTKVMAECDGPSSIAATSTPTADDDYSGDGDKDLSTISKGEEDRPRSITLAVSEWLKTQGEDALTPVATLMLQSSSSPSDEDVDGDAEDSYDDDEDDPDYHKMQSHQAQGSKKQDQKNEYGNPWAAPSSKTLGKRCNSRSADRLQISSEDGTTGSRVASPSTTTRKNDDKISKIKADHTNGCQRSLTKIPQLKNYSRSPQTGVLIKTHTTTTTVTVDPTNPTFTTAINSNPSRSSAKEPSSKEVFSTGDTDENENQSKQLDPTRSKTICHEESDSGLELSSPESNSEQSPQHHRSSSTETGIYCERNCSKTIPIRTTTTAIVGNVTTTSTINASSSSSTSGSSLATSNNLRTIPTPTIATFKEEGLDQKQFNYRESYATKSVDSICPTSVDTSISTACMSQLKNCTPSRKNDKETERSCSISSGTSTTVTSLATTNSFLDLGNITDRDKDHSEICDPQKFAKYYQFGVVFDGSSEDHGGIESDEDQVFSYMEHLSLKPTDEDDDDKHKVDGMNVGESRRDNIKKKEDFLRVMMRKNKNLMRKQKLNPSSANPKTATPTGESGSIRLQGFCDSAEDEDIGTFDPESLPRRSSSFKKNSMIPIAVDKMCTDSKKVETNSGSMRRSSKRGKDQSNHLYINPMSLARELRESSSSTGEPWSDSWDVDSEPLPDYEPPPPVELPIYNHLTPQSRVIRRLLPGEPVTMGICCSIQ